MTAKDYSEEYDELAGFMKKRGWKKEENGQRWSLKVNDGNTSGTLLASLSREFEEIDDDENDVD